VTLTVAARHRLDRRRLDGLALALNRDAWAPFAAGLAAFTVPSLLGLTFATLAGQIQLTPLVSGADLAASMASLLMTVFFYEALPEELIFRGYLLPQPRHSDRPMGCSARAGCAVRTLRHQPVGAHPRLGRYHRTRNPVRLRGNRARIIRLISGSVCIGFQATAQTLSRPNLASHDPVELFGILPSFLLGTTLVAITLRRPTNRTRSAPGQG